MAGKFINIEETKPSYDEVIGELSSMVSRLLVENSIMKINVKKLEDTINEYNSQLEQQSKTTKQ